MTNYDFMVPVYVALIKMGRKKIEEVPKIIRSKVKAALKK